LDFKIRGDRIRINLDSDFRQPCDLTSISNAQQSRDLPREVGCRAIAKDLLREGKMLILVSGTESKLQ
jgi:hypothetical protein